MTNKIPCLTSPKHRSRGFTLIELMIAVAIIGILVSIAFPAYQNYLKKARRGAAQAHLMDVAQRQQQYLLDARSYAPTVAALGVTVPTEVSPYYDDAVITIPDPGLAAPSFLVSLAPKAGTPQVGDYTLTINSAGQKGPSGAW